MPRRRSFRRRRSFGRARRFIRRTVSHMGPIEAKRIIFEAVSIPAKTSTSFDNPLTVNLLVAQESVDEEIESDGSSNIAQCRPYSKVVGMKINAFVSGMSSTNQVRWMLLKYPDGEGLLSSLSDGSFHSSNDTPTMREVRATTLAKGVVIGTDKTGMKLNIFVKRKTLRRLGSMREGDKLVLFLASNASGGITLTCMGTIYVRMN